MYHSVYFGNMNSFSDWHLVPDGRPVIALPEPKEVTVEVPGGQGVIDLSETLTKYPLYGNRSGNLSFIVLNGYGEWQTLYETISNYLHGKKVDIRLEDDPDWIYKGRCKVSWDSQNDGTWSKVTIDYTLDPFKYYRTTTSVSVSLASGSSYIDTRVLQNDKSNPMVPTVQINSNTTTGLIFYSINPELGLTKTNTQMTPITSNGTHKLYSCVLSNMSGSNNCRLGVSKSQGSSGAASFTINFDRVML